MSLRSLKNGGGGKIGGGGGVKRQHPPLLLCFFCSREGKAAGKKGLKDVSGDLPVC